MLSNLVRDVFADGVSTHCKEILYLVTSLEKVLSCDKWNLISNKKCDFPVYRSSEQESLFLERAFEGSCRANYREGINIVLSFKDKPFTLNKIPGYLAACEEGHVALVEELLNEAKTLAKGTPEILADLDLYFKGISRTFAYGNINLCEIIKAKCESPIKKLLSQENYQKLFIGLLNCGPGHITSYLHMLSMYGGRDSLQFENDLIDMNKLDTIKQISQVYTFGGIRAFPNFKFACLRKHFEIAEWILDGCYSSNLLTWQLDVLRDAIENGSLQTIYYLLFGSPRMSNMMKSLSKSLIQELGAFLLLQEQLNFVKLNFTRYINNKRISNSGGDKSQSFLSTNISTLDIVSLKAELPHEPPKSFLQKTIQYFFPWNTLESTIGKPAIKELQIIATHFVDNPLLYRLQEECNLQHGQLKQFGLDAWTEVLDNHYSKCIFYLQDQNLANLPLVLCKLVLAY